MPFTSTEPPHSLISYSTTSNHRPCTLEVIESVPSSNLQGKTINKDASIAIPILHPYTSSTPPSAIHDSSPPSEQHGPKPCPPNLFSSLPLTIGSHASILARDDTNGQDHLPGIQSGQHHSHPHNLKSSVPSPTREGGVRIWDRQPGAPSVDPITTTMPTAGDPTCYLHSGDKLFDFPVSSDHAFLPQPPGLGLHHELDLCALGLPDSLNQENPNQEQRKETTAKLTTKMLQGTNAELEALLASFGEQRERALALEKPIVKEFWDLTSEIVIILCPRDLTQCAMKLRNE